MMTDTYKMELTEEQLRWLLQREFIQNRINDDAKFLRQIEDQNCAMQLIIEQLIELAEYENTSHYEIAAKSKKSLTEFYLTKTNHALELESEWYNSVDLLQHIKNKLK